MQSERIKDASLEKWNGTQFTEDKSPLSKSDQGDDEDGMTIS
jgi:hypothetical protein